MEANDVVSEAEYADIIITLLSPPFLISSIAKLVFIAFCVKHENELSRYYSRTKDFVDVFISNVSIKLSVHYQEIRQIVNMIDMLNKTSKVSVNGDNIKLRERFAFQTENEFLRFCSSKEPNPIGEIDRLDAKALIEEVLRYV